MGAEQSAGNLSSPSQESKFAIVRSPSMSASAEPSTSTGPAHRHSAMGALVSAEHSVVHSVGSALHRAEHAVEAAARKVEHAVEHAAIRAEHAVENAAIRAEHAAESAAKIAVAVIPRRLKKLKPQRAALPGAPVHASLDAFKHLVAPEDAHCCERFRDATLTMMVRLNKCAPCPRKPDTNPTRHAERAGPGSLPADDGRRSFFMFLVAIMIFCFLINLVCIIIMIIGVILRVNLGGLTEWCAASPPRFAPRACHASRAHPRRHLHPHPHPLRPPARPSVHAPPHRMCAAGTTTASI